MGGYLIKDKKWMQILLLIASVSVIAVWYGMLGIQVCEAKTEKPVKLEQIQWEKAEKVYDGKREAALSGYYQEKTEKNKVTICLELKENSAKTYTEGVVQKVIKQPENYELEECRQKKISDICVTVYPKNLYLQVEDYEAEYEITAEELEKDLKIHGKVKIKEGAFREDLEKIDLPQVSFQESYPELKIGEYEHCLAPELKDENGKLINPFEGVVQGNYCLKIAKEEDFGKLVIVPQKIGTAKSIIVAEKREGVFQKEGREEEIWIRGNGEEEGDPLKVKLDIRADSPAAKRYDEVWAKIKGTDEAFVNATKDGIIFTEQSEEVRKQTVEWYLKDSRDSSGNTVTKTEEGLYFLIDREAPKVRFQGLSLENHKVEGGERLLTFGSYRNHSYSEKIFIEDQEDTAEEGSGAESWYYAVWDVKQDWKLTENLVDQLTKSGELQWNQIVSDSVCEIPVGIGKQGKMKEGNYVILVRTKDHVGNQAVFVSDGLILDTSKPKLSLSGINEDRYYTEDIPISIAIEDYDLEEKKITSGISKIQVALSCDGIECFCETEKIQENVSEPGGTIGKTLQELWETGEIARKRIIQASRHNSNDVKLSVTVWDGAENQTVAEQQMKIDTIAPQITVSYDNNEVRNGNYFQRGRTARISYQDKNFDREEVAFDVCVGEKAKKNVSVQELKREFGIQADWEEKECLHLTFEEENEYEMKPHCMDRAGNREQEVCYGDSAAPERFVIDKTDPFVEVQYDCGGKQISVTELEEKRIFKNQKIKAEITIRESYFALQKGFSEEQRQIEFFVKAKGMKKEEDCQSVEREYQAKAEQMEEWKQTAKNTYTGTFLFEKDANYTVEFAYTDLSGRKVKLSPRFFTVDQTEPKGRILVDGQENMSETCQNLSFCLFKKEPYQVKVSGEDITAGVDSVKYYCSKRSLSEEELTKLPEEKWVKAEEFTVNPDCQAAVYGKIEDRAGNIRFLYPVNGMIVDGSKPKVKIKLEGKENQGIYCGDVTAKIEAEEPLVGNTYSGVEQVFYQITAEENVQTNMEEILFQKEDSTKQGKAKWKGEVVIPAETFNSNDVKFQIWVKDYAGNETVESKEKIQIDLTAPVIEVSYDNQISVNEKYYRQPRSAIISVKERNFDEEAVKFQIESSSGKQPAIGQWNRQQNEADTDDTTYTCTVGFQEDGEYAFSLQCADRAGNRTKYQKRDSFIIDQTAPVIQVAYQEQKEETSGYYKEPRRAIITIQEKNFCPDDVEIKMTAFLDGQAQTTPKIGSFTKEKSRELSSQRKVKETAYSASILYEKDGTYTFDISYTDLAGNIAKAYPEDQFTIDQTMPSVEILGVEDQSANNDVAAPGIRCQDRNYEEKNVRIELNGYRRGNIKTEGQKTEIVNGQYIQLPDFERTQEQDDLYTLKVQMTDKAGNQMQKAVTFSVNRFGSVYTFSDKTRKLLQKRYTAEPPEIEVTEINVDRLERKEISYGRDGELVKLEHGKDYTVEASEPQAGWKKYVYKIYKENFQKEGNYTVIISSEDQAENSGNNKVKGKEIHFVVDRTAPSIVVVGIENYGKYKVPSKKMTVCVEDNFAAKQVEVSIAGEKEIYKKYDAGTLKRQGGKAEVNIEQEDGWKKVRVVGADAAGNKSEEKVFHILVTSNRWIPFFYNLPSAAGVAVVILIVFCGGKFLARRNS